jgi:hypothetical protein
MSKNSVLLDEGPAAPINVDTLAEVKREDMKQAVVERFRGRIKNRTAARAAKGAPELQVAESKS